MQLEPDFGVPFSHVQLFFGGGGGGGGVAVGSRRGLWKGLAGATGLAAVGEGDDTTADEEGACSIALTADPAGKSPSAVNDLGPVRCVCPWLSLVPSPVIAPVAAGLWPSKFHAREAEVSPAPFCALASTSMRCCCHWKTQHSNTAQTTNVTLRRIIA